MSHQGINECLQLREDWESLLWKSLWELLTRRWGKTEMTRSLIEHGQDKQSYPLLPPVAGRSLCREVAAKGVQPPETIECICKNNTNLEYTSFLFINNVWPYASILKHFWDKLRHIKERNMFIMHLFPNIFLWASNQIRVLWWARWCTAQVCPHPNPQSLWMWPHLKKGFEDVIKLKILRWGGHVDYVGVP